MTTHAKRGAAPVGRRAFLGSAALGAAAAIAGCSTRRKADGPRFDGGVAAFEVREHEATLWLRTNRAATVRFEYAEDRSFQGAKTTPKVVTSSETDFIHTAHVEGLRPGTRHHYRAVLGDAPGPAGQFVTTPDRPAPLRLAWGADLLASYRPFDALTPLIQNPPDLWLMLGDTVYANRPKNDPARDLAGFRRKHREVRGCRKLQELLSLTAVSAIWDDHEVDNNFHRESPLIVPGRQAFLENWPVHPAEPAKDGLYRSFRWGPEVEIFILDCRSFRDSHEEPASADKTMLGPAQKRWFFSALSASVAKHKLIVSSVPFLGPFRDDSWFGFAHERDEIRTFIREKRVSGITILSGDFHVAWELRDDDLGLREFIAGPMGAWPFSKMNNPKKHAAIVAASKTFARMDTLNFGWIEIDPADPRPTLRFIDGSGARLYETRL